MIKRISYFLMLCIFALAACSSNSKDEPEAPVNEKVNINTSVQSLSLSDEQQQTKITVTADADWNITSNADWCKVMPSGGVKNETTDVTVTVGQNKDMDARAAVLTVKAKNATKEISVVQNPKAIVLVSTNKITAGGTQSKQTLTINANTPWIISSADTWCTVNPKSGDAGETEVTVIIDENTSAEQRTTFLTVNYIGGKEEITVNQLSDAIDIPEGYHLVWSDEFNDPTITMPDENLWWYEVANPGWVNNELQRYVAGKKGDKVTAEVSNGILKIHAIKDGNEVISARVNTKESWTYGYFEARLKLPKGKGTWPAYWMMPKQSGSWPACGEIDIMEEVGYHPNYTSSSIHCTAYNHVKGTQKTKEVYTSGAEDEFHVYALEWTEDFIQTYIDGKPLFYFANDKKGNNDTWPFNKDFYIKLNLAWGGDWGGAQGVDESVLPATYEIDYVRVFQK